MTNPTAAKGGCYVLDEQTNELRPAEAAPPAVSAAPEAAPAPEPVTAPIAAEPALAETAPDQVSEEPAATKRRPGKGN